MTPSARATFDLDGFLSLPQFLSPSDIAGLRSAWQRFLTHIAPTLDKRAVMYEDYNDPSTIKQSHALALEPAFAAWRDNSPIRQLAESLIGPVAPQHVEYFDKPPGRNLPTPPHQDGFYFCLQPNTAITIWVPLQPIDATNGALAYVRGSHLLGVRPHASSNVLGFSQGMTEDPATLGDIVLCPVQPGDVLAHHSLTIHMAAANLSNRPRPVIAFTYFGAHTQRDPGAVARYEAALLQQHQQKGLV